MPHSLYDGTIRNILAILRSMDHCLNVAEKTVPDTQKLVTARLIDDMKPLSYQIYVATRTAHRLLAVMLKWDELPQYVDNLTTFAEFHDRLNTVISALSAVKPEDINTKGEELSNVVMVAPTQEGVTQLTGAANAFGAALPNIQFHASMTYAILRKEGIPLGKQDYISSFVSEYC